MNNLQKLLNEKKIENGDKAYKTTGDNLAVRQKIPRHTKKNKI